MGIDGFSMSNLGINRNMSSAQLANEAEATAKQALENQMADVDGVGKKEKTRMLLLTALSPLLVNLKKKKMKRKAPLKKTLTLLQILI